MSGTRAGTVLERLMQDEHVHQQISSGADRLWAAYRRGRTMRTQQAVQDQKLYDHVRVAAGALTEAARRVAGKPEPEPKRRWRRLPVIVTALGVAAFVRRMDRTQQAAAPGPGPPAASTPAR